VYGARPLKRVIQNEVENTLAHRIIAGEVRDGERLLVDAGPSGLVFRPGEAGNGAGAGGAANSA
jgi:ATP-dependent Clp protease ATP-binding subunit ClpB